MKIILFLCCLLSLSAIFAQSEDCSYLGTKDGFFSLTFTSSSEDIEREFNNAYAINVCEAFVPIDEEVIEYIQGIRKITDKTLVEVIHDIGNIFCREFFGECNAESFYGRYEQACDDARAKTIEEGQKDETPVIPNNTELLLASFHDTCTNLANTKLKIYKEVAYEEAAKYASNMVENSNKTYLEKAHEVFNKLQTTANTVLKMFGDIARSFQAFTDQAHV